MVDVTGHDRQRHPGEDVGIITLSGVVGLTPDTHRGEGTATGKDTPALGKKTISIIYCYL